MSKKDDHKSGGGQIVPSARRGIHQSQKSSQLEPQDIMGRIGIRDDDQLDIDETDNIQSKPSKSQDILVQSRSQKIRQNSTDNSTILSSDDDTNEENNSDYANTLTKHNTSSRLDTSPGKGFYGVPEDRQASWSHSNNEINCSINKMNKSASIIKEEKTYITPLTVFGILVCLFSIYIAFQYMDTSQSNISYNVFNFYNDMDNLRIKYQMSRDSILQVKSGISTIYDREDTGSFIFLYNSNTDKFITKKIHQLLDDISLTAAKYLRNDTLPVKHLAIAGSELQMSYHRDLINRYRGDVSKTGVMLVKDVDNVPSNLAMAFHYYCDEYNPLVRRSAIFFTLDLTNCDDKSVFKSTHAQIENCLTKKWSSVPKDKIKPLLTRVVSVVIDLTNIF